MTIRVISHHNPKSASSQSPTSSCLVFGKQRLLVHRGQLLNPLAVDLCACSQGLTFSVLGPGLGSVGLEGSCHSPLMQGYPLAVVYRASCGVGCIPFNSGLLEPPGAVQHSDILGSLLRVAMLCRFQQFQPSKRCRAWLPAWRMNRLSVLPKAWDTLTPAKPPRFQAPLPFIEKLGANDSKGLLCTRG